MRRIKVSPHNIVANNALEPLQGGHVEDELPPVHFDGKTDVEATCEVREFHPVGRCDIGPLVFEDFESLRGPRGGDPVR
jgi:hypothetical protein